MRSLVRKWSVYNRMMKRIEGSPKCLASMGIWDGSEEAEG